MAEFNTADQTNTFIDNIKNRKDARINQKQKLTIMGNTLSNVAHDFATRIKTKGSTPNGSLWFEDGTIYSYGRHFPIAKFRTDPKTGTELVLFTRHSYSVSTAKHVRIVSQALRQYDRIYVRDLAECAATNIEKWCADVKLLFVSLAVARKKEKYISEIKHTISEIKTYASFTGTKLNKESEKILSHFGAANFDAYLQKEADRIKADRIKADKKAKVAFDKNLNSWRSFKTNRLFINPTGFDFLRYNNESKRIETSQDVKIPLEIALRFYSHIKTVLSNGGCKNCDQSILHYDVKEINTKFMQIGCHKIQLSEVENLVKTNKLI
jgi:hypothetical protein